MIPSEILHWWMDFIGMQFSFGFFIGSSVGDFLLCPPDWHPQRYCWGGGGVPFWIFALEISMPPCLYFLVWLVGFWCWYEFLHLCRTFVVCWVVLGETLMCMIFFPLLFLGCMSYCICSVLYLVLCTIHILHVVNIMLNILDYCELLFLSLVLITVCSCNQILEICEFRLIGRE